MGTSVRTDCSCPCGDSHIAVSDASALLVGKSRQMPGGVRHAGEASASDFCIARKPGSAMPPRNTPLASSASTVISVPALTTTQGGGNSSLASARLRAATIDDQRAGQSCEGSS